MPLGSTLGGMLELSSILAGNLINPLGYNGTLLRGAVSIMAMMTNLSAYENNDTPFPLQVTLGNYPLNLSGYTPKVTVKANSLATDASGITYTVGSGVTITNSQLGQLTFTLPHSAASTAGNLWWRLDVTDSSGNVSTSMYGNLYILAV